MSRSSSAAQPQPTWLTPAIVQVPQIASCCAATRAECGGARAAYPDAHRFRHSEAQATKRIKARGHARKAPKQKASPHPF